MNKNTLPNTLKELRKANGFNQDYVASILGIVRQSYSHYETGKRCPSPEILYKLSRLYNISVDSLMELSMDSNITIENTSLTSSSTSTSSAELSRYLSYFNNPVTAKKLQNLTNLEKELLYYFDQISESDKKEIIEFTKIKAKKSNS